MGFPASDCFHRVTGVLKLAFMHLSFEASRNSSVLPPTAVVVSAAVSAVAVPAAIVVAAIVVAAAAVAAAVIASAASGL